MSVDVRPRQSLRFGAASDNSPEILEAAASTSRWHLVVVAGLLLAHASLAWFNRTLTVGSLHDEGAYIMLARSLRSFQYRDVYLLGAPVHAQYPPGFPAMLALVLLAKPILATLLQHGHYTAHETPRRNRCGSQPGCRR